MKILLPFKSVPDPYAGAGAAAKSVINPFDEIAIEKLSASASAAKRPKL